MSAQTAYLFAGLPGAGKTEAADQAVDIAGGDIISAGTMIRQMAAEDGLTNPTSAELGEYAAECREEDGPGFFAERVHGLYLRDEIDIATPCFIDSVRHAEGVAEFREMFDDCYLVWVEAPFDTRLRRLQERGRDDEADFDSADLMERDNRELGELGVQSILDDARIDHTIKNTGHRRDLRSSLDRIIHG
jgi:dephospho-CoA kinase